MLRWIKNRIICMIKGHQWEKDKGGFEPIRGCWFMAWSCKRCHKVITRREKLDPDWEI